MTNLKQTIQADNSSPATMLARISTALLMVFVVTILSAAFPPKLLDPSWQLTVISALINNGSIAVVGFLLLPLARWIAPENEQIEARSIAVRRWAIAAVLGYLLIIPLQIYAVWQGMGNARIKQERQANQANQSISQLRSVISSATNLQELQRQLQSFTRGPALSPAELEQPLPELKKGLLARLDQANSSIRQQLATNDSRSRQSIPIFKQTIHVVILSIAYALAFAAGARRRYAEFSFLTETQLKFIELYSKLMDKTPARKKSRSDQPDEELIRQLSGEE